MKKDRNDYPPGWDAEKVRDLIEYYEDQTDEEAIAEDEAAYHNARTTMMAVPIELVPEVCQLLKRHVLRTQKTAA